MICFYIYEYLTLIQKCYIYTIQTRSGNTIQKGEKGDTRVQRVAKRDLGGGIIFKIIFAKTHPEIMHPILIIRLNALSSILMPTNIS